MCRSVLKVFLTGMCCSLVMLILATGTVQAAGFALMEQTVKGLGNAFAGGAASAEDATTVYLNPAGMTLLSGQQISTGLHVIKTSFKFSNSGSTHALQPITGEGLTGYNGGNAGTWNFVPNLYYVNKLNDSWAVGLGINVPFGLTTDWGEGWVGRYYAVKSSIMTLNINPSVAYQVNEKLSIGAGVSVMYMKGEFSQAVDYGTIFNLLGGNPQRDDGKVTLNADDWGYGYNLGVLYQFNHTTRVGISYRSQVDQNLTGDANYTFNNEVTKNKVAAMIAASPYSTWFQDGGAGSSVTLPDSATISLFHQLNPKLALMADIGWAGWSSLPELRIVFDSSQPDSTTTLNWKDAWRFGAGATYQYSDKLKLRCGAMYDQTPIPGPEYRTPRLPDQDRLWTNLGASYAMTKQMSFDFGYSHLFMLGNGDINQAATGENATRGGLTGTFDNTGNIFSAQINYNW
ncbi:OmpP1/FadL family transporter [Geopsychrobacter electrodiphilus]|uniref:OmpP1/FadL family transporter n=1 Tax=Geopsychrobacter electrodiphilus TaxID=225196 RepID=UPI000381A727|nr:outer membrane protein transport protein [Geopsychrobacter electrodiphilus]